MRTTMRRHRWAATGLAMVLALTACGSDDDSGSEATEGAAT